MDKIKNFFRHETVLCIAFLAALISMIFVPPSREYLDYINWRVLGLLWCLMAVVAGFRRCGVFETLTVSLLARSRGKGRLLALLLVLLPFFSAMLITNDVALLTFVPFTLGVLQTAGCMAWAPYLLVLQTAAAVLGSAATPVGDPHNLFVYASYAMTPGEFFSAALPVVGICALGLIAAALPALPAAMPVSKLWKPEPIPPKRCAI